MKNFLYNVDGWTGEFTEDVTIDDNGDVGGAFQIKQAVGGELMVLE